VQNARRRSVTHFFVAMEVIIRRAEAEDIPGMLALVRELAAFEREPEAVTVTEEEMRDAGFGPKPVWFGWVAAAEQAILGMAVCYERYSTWRGRVGYLEDLIVTEHARGARIGERLLQACARHAVEQGYHHITWQVLDWNHGALRFYARAQAEITNDWLNGRLYQEQLKRIALA
jgi:ribosomal protein S18 acetylase RimI-like enzyme